MTTIVSMHAWKSWIIPIRENTTWIERSKSKLSNHRCGAMHKIRIQLYHFPPPPFVPHSAWTIPSEQSFTSVSIYPISISRKQSVAITPFWRIEPIRYAWKKKNNARLSRARYPSPFPKRPGTEYANGEVQSIENHVAKRSSCRLLVIYHVRDRRNTRAAFQRSESGYQSVAQTCATHI